MLASAVLLVALAQAAGPPSPWQEPSPSASAPVTPRDAVAEPAREEAPPAADQQPDVSQSAYVADFLKTARGQRIGLRDERGGLAIGRLVGVNGTNAIVRVRGRDLVVPAQHIEQVETQGDSPWDGLRKGLVVGLAFWAIVVAQGDSGLDKVEDNPDDFTRADTWAMIATFAGLGFALDYVHEGTQTIFVAPMPRDAGVPMGSASSVAPTGRRFALRYRVSF